MEQIELSIKRLKGERGNRSFWTSLFLIWWKKRDYPNDSGMHTDDTYLDVYKTSVVVTTDFKSQAKPWAWLKIYTIFRL